MKKLYSILLASTMFLAACAGTGAQSTVAVDLPASTGTVNEVVVTSSAVLSSTMSAGETAIPGAVQSGVATALPATGAEFDQMFIDMMVPHHESAVEMAKLALEKAQDPTIRQMAEDIIAAQQQEITQMRDWRQQWYGSSETPPMSAMPALTGMEGMSSGMHSMDMQAEVEKLRSASNFDIAFIQAMIPHHIQAIEAAQLALQQAKHAEIKQMAQAIIDAQQQEIEQMQALLAQLGGSLAVTPTP
jgi:uncharacterized protein (DUF305 family)